MMKKLLPLWIIANAVLLLAVPVAFSFYVRRMVDEEYATGARTTSDGDRIIIPVAGMFVFTLFTLVSINAVIACVYAWRRRRRLP